MKNNAANALYCGLRESVFRSSNSGEDGEDQEEVKGKTLPKVGSCMRVYMRGFMLPVWHI